MMPSNPFGDYSMPSKQTLAYLEKTRVKLQSRIRKEFSKAGVTYRQASQMLYLDENRIRWAVELDNHDVNALPMLIDILYRMGILTEITIEGA